MGMKFLDAGNVPEAQANDEGNLRVTAGIDFEVLRSAHVVVRQVERLVGPSNAAWRHYTVCISFNKSGCRSSSLRSLTNGVGGRVSPRS